MTVNAKDGFSERLICYSLIHPPAGRAGDLRVLQLVHNENSASLLLTREERELLVKLKGVGGKSLCSAELKACLRFLQALVPLGARD